MVAVDAVDEVVLEVVADDVTPSEGSGGGVGEVVGSRRSGIDDEDGIFVSRDVLEKKKGVREYEA